MKDMGLLEIGVIAALCGVAVLRWSWGRPKRSTLLNGSGWALLLAALIVGWADAGAWGASIISLWAMTAAFVALAWAIWCAPRARRAASNRRAGMLPESGEPARIGRRVGTFLVVTVLAMLASIALAVGVRWAMMLAGAGEANANVLALFVAPLGWTILAFLILMSGSRKRQFMLVALTAATALPAIFMRSAL